MKKLLLFGIVLLLMSSLIYALDCDKYDCDWSSGNYNFIDKSNKAYDGDTISCGDSAATHGYSLLSANPLYTCGIYNTTPMSINASIPAGYVKHIPINEGSYTAACIDVYYKKVVTPGTTQVHYTYGGDTAHSNYYFVQAGQKCDTDDTGALCFTCNDGYVFDDYTTNIIAGEWYSLCVYWTGSNTHMSIFQGDTNIENMTRNDCTALDDYPFNGEDLFAYSSSTPVGTEFYIDNFRTGNWSVGEMGILLPPPLIAPIISNARCTSCISGTNNTIDTTPTINFTVTDDETVSGTCISNSSVGNYSDCITRGGLCNAGAGDDWVCTIPDNQKFTTPQMYTVYAWANDSGNTYHTVYNLSIDLTYIDPCVYSGTGNWDIYSYCEYTDLNFNIDKNVTLKEDATMNCTVSHCNLNCTENNQYLIFENIETYIIKLIGNWTINQPN